MQPGPGVGAQPDNIAGVWRDLRCVENNVKHLRRAGPFCGCVVGLDMRLAHLSIALLAGLIQACCTRMRKWFPGLCFSGLCFPGLCFPGRASQACFYQNLSNSNLSNSRSPACHRMNDRSLASIQRLCQQRSSQLFVLFVVLLSSL